MNVFTYPTGHPASLSDVGSAGRTVPADTDLAFACSPKDDAPMPDQWVSTQSSGQLRGRRSRDTQPELLLRRALHAAGARFRLHRQLARGCTPDLVLPARRVAVFVDGDFWHGCPLHGRKGFQGPNAALWEAKMARNRERDARSTRLAQEAGWVVVRLWECEVRQDPAQAVRRVLTAAQGQFAARRRQ
jgi:DNA mismatch endonuclease, patch repair protein